MTYQEARKVARALSALQTFILQQAAAHPEGWVTFYAPIGKLAGAGHAYDTLRRKGLLESHTRNGAQSRHITAAGRAVLAASPGLDHQVRRNTPYLRVLQNAFLTPVEYVTDGWIVKWRLLDGLGGRQRANDGLLQALCVIGYLEVNASGSAYRLTARGRAFRQQLFTPDEMEAVSYFGHINLQDPAVYIPRPDSRQVRVATNPLFTLSRPRRISKVTVNALVRRGLLVKASNADAYKATRKALWLVRPKTPAMPVAYAVGGEYVRECLEAVPDVPEAVPVRGPEWPAESEPVWQAGEPAAEWAALDADQQEALLIGETDTTEFDLATLTALVKRGLMRRYDYDPPTARSGGSRNRYAQEDPCASYQLTDWGEKVVEAVSA